jgi:hypothetical protein
MKHACVRIVSDGSRSYAVRSPTSEHAKYVANDSSLKHEREEAASCVVRSRTIEPAKRVANDNSLKHARGETTTTVAEAAMTIGQGTPRLKIGDDRRSECTALATTPDETRTARAAIENAESRVARIRDAANAER